MSLLWKIIFFFLANFQHFDITENENAYFHFALKLCKMNVHFFLGFFDRNLNLPLFIYLFFDSQ